MKTPGIEIDAIEVYSGAASVPAIFSGSDAECGVIAVWLRHGERFPAVQPLSKAVSPASVTFAANIAASKVSGRNAPTRTVGLEADVQWGIWDAVTAGIIVGYSRGTMTAQDVSELTTDLGYGDATNARAMSLVTLGAQARISLREAAAVRPFVHVRFLVAQRTVNPFEASNAEPISSRGSGFGAGAGIEASLRDALQVHLDITRPTRFSSIRQCTTPG